MRIIELSADGAQHNAFTVFDQRQLTSIEYQTDIWIFEIELLMGAG